MILLICSIVLFNITALKTNNVLSINKILHIWTFTMAFQLLFDLLIEFKFEAYWYFSKDEIDWQGVLARTVLVPPVNMMFINHYPLRGRIGKKVFCFFIWTVGILIYELIALLPAPWGYFHYGWWNLGYSAMVDPILFLILLSYYKWICIIEGKIL